MRFNLSIGDVISSPVRFTVAEFLLTHDASMSEREIASIIKISHMSVNRAMMEFARINFVSFKVVGNAHLWSVNRKSYAYRVINALVGCVKSQPNPLTVLKDRVLKYLSGPGVVRVVLFGSVARGEAREDSDIDLFIVVKRDKDKDILEPALEKLSADCLDLFGNRLAPYIVSERQWKAEKSSAVLREAEKGAVLYTAPQ